MLDYFRSLFSENGLAPHGYCLLWDSNLIWTHVSSDLLIALAYFSIPAVLARLITARRDVQFGWVVWMFAAFIMACGTTHVMSIVTLYKPYYGLEGFLKAITASVSVLTAVALWPLLPKVIALPSPAQLQLANDVLELRVRERDEAVRALRHEMAERERVEDLFRQAQKMEAVGQLTGGMAHDFNNLLTIVVGNLDRANRLADGDQRLKRSIDGALAGAERAARLTEQLLAFSRRQPLQPKATNVSKAIKDLDEILRATLGSRNRLELELADNLPAVRVDGPQLENAVLNLAINARDAMAEGGILTIATVLYNDGVEIRVSDTGTGMTEEIRAKAFEPFFTTKALGQGTGLGLSQVYGFIKQSGGDVAVISEPGRGTTIRLWLPAAGAPA